MCMHCIFITKTVNLLQYNIKLCFQIYDVILCTGTKGKKEGSRISRGAFMVSTSAALICTRKLHGCITKDTNSLWYCNTQGLSLFSKAPCLYSQLKEMMEKLNLNHDGMYILEIFIFKGHLHLPLYFDICVCLVHVKFCFLYYSFTTPKFEGQIISIYKDDARHIYPTWSPSWR